MTTGAAITLICIGLPVLAVLIGTAIGSHFGADTGSDDPHP